MNKTVFSLLIISSFCIGCSPLLTKKNGFSSSISKPLVTSQGHSDLGRGSDIYQLLRGEFAVQSGDFTLSFDIYSTLARNSHDKKLLKKTVNLALLSEKYVEAYFFSKRLCQLVKDYECYAVYTALAAKLDLVDDDFFLENGAERFFSENPGFFLRLISNHLALMRAPISAHAVLLDALKSLDFFDVLSVDHSDMLAVLAIESADYVQAMKYISSHISEKGLNLSLVQLLIAEAEKSLAPTVLRTWINSIRQFFPEDRQLALWEALFLSKLGRYKPAKNLIEKFYINDRDDDHVALSFFSRELHLSLYYYHY